MLSVVALDGIEQVEDCADFLAISASERDMRAGEWYLEMPRDSAGARALRGVTYPGIEIYDQRDDSRFGGFVTRRGIRRDGPGEPEVAYFYGLDFQGWLQGWLAWPDTTDVSNFWDYVGGNTLSATSAMHNYADYTFGLGALPERQMPNVAGIWVNDPDGGPVPSWIVEGQPILSLYRGWCTGTDYTFRLRLNRPSVGGGELLFSTPQRGTVAEPFDIETGSLSSYDAAEVAALATRAIGMGDEDTGPGALPGQRFVTDQVTPSVDWRSRYWEVLRNRETLDQAQLDTDIADWAQTLRQTESIDLADARVAGWGSLIDLGWTAELRLETDVTISAPVAATTLRAEGGSEAVRTISFGSEALGAQELMLDRMSRMAERIARLERGR